MCEAAHAADWVGILVLSLYGLWSEGLMSFESKGSVLAK